MDGGGHQRPEQPAGRFFADRGGVGILDVTQKTAIADDQAFEAGGNGEGMFHRFGAGQQITLVFDIGPADPGIRRQ